MTEIPDGIQVRQAVPSDYENVVEMQYPSWRQSYAGILTPYVLDLFDRQKWADEEYAQRLSRSGWAMWLAESDGQLMGMSIFGPDLGNPDHLEIDSLYVAVENQRRGVGGLLLDKALRSQPSGDVVVWCAEKNHRAAVSTSRKASSSMWPGLQMDADTWCRRGPPGGLPALSIKVSRLKSHYPRTSWRARGGQLERRHTRPPAAGRIVARKPAPTRDDTPKAVCHNRIHEPNLPVAQWCSAASKRCIGVYRPGDQPILPGRPFRRSGEIENRILPRHPRVQEK